MGNKSSNYPTAQASRELQKADSFISDTLGGISAMTSMEKPQNEGELKERIKMYFDYCKNNSFRPGVESLSLALGVDRTTFWRWCNRETNVSLDWAKTCKAAKQSIIAFTESAAISGHLSPPVAIFILKNVAGYKDAVSFEDATQNNAICNVLIARDLPVLKSDSDENVNL